MPMSSISKRVTIYFDPALHRALRVKAAETDRSLSDLVNEAIRLSLSEDAEDLAAFEERAIEPDITFEDVVKDLKRSGAI
jgi:plasmid stability protein